ncbi:MAG: AAA family ATPase, partial [Myxococcota bacterium]
DDVLAVHVGQCITDLVQQPSELREQLMVWLIQISDALAYMHSQHIVHADLKPGNILFNDRHEPVIIDFGLATSAGTRVDVRAMEKAGLLAGSLSYINPEQLQGDILDPRADLYALGCILFECLAGRPPFVSTKPNVLINMHIHALPPLLSNLDPTIPPKLSHLVESLLAKNRDRRPGHAQTVSHMLRAFVEHPAPIQVGASARDAPPPYLFKPALIGRSELLERLLEALEGLGDEQGRMVALTGESGVGKTRLMLELIREARRQKCLVLIGHAQMLPSANAPLGLFVPLLRSMVDYGLEHDTGTHLFPPEDIAVLLPYAPFIGQLLDPSADEEPLPELPHAMARLRVFQSLTRVLELFCGERAALLVFDDLQWADALSLAALEHLITHLERKPWLIAATLRAEEVTPAVHALLELPGCDLLHVERLDDVTIRRLTALMLGQTPSPLLAETIARRSSGNPFFVAEHLQALIESRTLELNSTGRWTMTASLAELPEPDSIQSLIADRITRLPPHARMVGEVGSLLGRRVDLGLLRTLVSMPPYGAARPDVRGRCGRRPPHGACRGQK